MRQESSLLDVCNSALNRKTDNDVKICWYDVIANFFQPWCVSLVKFSYCFKFSSISWLFLELWQFLFIKDWPETRTLEIPKPEFCPIYEDWVELGISNMARMSLINGYWILQNARVTAFTFSELLRENQHGIKLPSLSPSVPLMLRSKMMKNAFYFTLKALFVLKIFKHLSSLFVQREKPLEEKDKINSKIYDVSTCNQSQDIWD